MIETGQEFGLGLLVAALALGLRHGIDWDHLAAISDITATQESRRKGIRLGSLYALGHAAVVFVIGVVAIVAGRSLPGWADAAMGYVVGWTLVLLGIYVAYSLISSRGEFRMRSRWMLIIAGARRVWAAMRPKAATSRVWHDHEHAAVADIHHHSDDEPAPVAATGGRLRAPTHSHVHAHSSADAFADYGTATSVGVGMLHGIGAETPTQVLVFLAAANAGGPAAGVIVLVAFLIGLLLANTAITLFAAFGFSAASGKRLVYRTVGAATAAVSLVVGSMLVLGYDAALPALLVG